MKHYMVWNETPYGQKWNTMWKGMKYPRVIRNENTTWPGMKHHMVRNETSSCQKWNTMWTGMKYPRVIRNETPHGQE
jgi:hypothetical protein